MIQFIYHYKCFVFVLGPLFSGDTMVHHMPNVALSLLLLVERFRKDKESDWLPYLNMLPSRYTTVLYFTPQQLQELRGSPALGKYFYVYMYIHKITLGCFFYRKCFTLICLN